LKFDLKSRTQNNLQNIKHSALGAIHSAKASSAASLTRVKHSTTGPNGPSRKAATIGAASTVAAIAAAVVGLHRRQR